VTANCSRANDRASTLNLPHNRLNNFGLWQKRNADALIYQVMLISIFM
jgi:hypothetical protein